MLGRRAGINASAHVILEEASVARDLLRGKYTSLSIPGAGHVVQLVDLKPLETRCGRFEPGFMCARMHLGILCQIQHELSQLIDLNPPEPHLNHTNEEKEEEDLTSRPGCLRDRPG